jgi:hypothetical protein
MARGRSATQSSGAAQPVAPPWPPGPQHVCLQEFHGHAVPSVCFDGGLRLQPGGRLLSSETAVRWPPQAAWVRCTHDRGHPAVGGDCLAVKATASTGHTTVIRPRSPRPRLRCARCARSRTQGVAACQAHTVRAPAVRQLTWLHFCFRQASTWKWQCDGVIQERGCPGWEGRMRAKLALEEYQSKDGDGAAAAKGGAWEAGGGSTPVVAPPAALLAFCCTQLHVRGA